MKSKIFVLILTGLFSWGAYGESLQVTIYDAIKSSRKIGSVRLHDTQYGLLIEPKLTALPPGVHGFHVHEKPNCGAKAMAAAGHFDPQQTGKHLGPYGDGHLGDLPVLIVAADGKAMLPLLAPRLTVQDIRGRSLMIHAGGDNYSDHPKKLGGGGARLACGVIAKGK